MFNLSYANFSNTYRHHARQDRDTLLASLGWQAGQGAAGHRNGALCVSLALLGAGVPLAGNRRIEQGVASGKRVFTGANALADWRQPSPGR